MPRPHRSAVLCLLFLAGLLPACLAAQAGGAAAKAVNFAEPTRGYVQAPGDGATIWLESELASDHPELAQKATARLREKLAAVLAAVPPRTHALLRKRQIFLLLGERSRLGGKDNGAEYFSRGSSRAYPLQDPRWDHHLVIYSAPNYVWLSDLWAGKLLIHELAHSWQLEQWPEKQPDILKAYHSAMQANLYRQVKTADGATLEKGYAATNQLEYFAELSSMYFIGCDYYPFNRDDLRTYDPEGYAMIQRMWQTPEVEAVPAPWTGEDLGWVLRPGETHFADGAFTLEGSGADFQASADAGHFVYQTLEGDGEIVAHLAAMNPPDPWAKAGVMIRAGLEAGAPEACMVLAAAGARFQSRTASGGGTANAPGPALPVATWVRLQRKGDHFTGAVSCDGAAWTEVSHATIAIKGGALAGLAVTAHQNQELCTATFDHVAVSKADDPNIPAHREE